MMLYIFIKKMNKPDTTQSTPIVSTPRGTAVVEPSRFYPSCPVYQFPQYPQYYEPQYVQPTPQYATQPTPQYVQSTPQYATRPTPQYVQPTPQYVQPTQQTPQYATEQYQQFPQYYPQYQYPQFPQFPQYPQYQYPSQYLPDGCYCEIQYVIPYIVSKSNSPVASSQPPQTQQESLVVSM